MSLNLEKYVIDQKRKWMKTGWKSWKKPGKKCFFLIMLVFICLYRQSLTEYKRARIGRVAVCVISATNLGKSFLSGPWFPSW